MLSAAVQVASCFPGALEAVAEIEPDNAASLRCAQRVGFRESGRTEHGDIALSFDLPPS